MYLVGPQKLQLKDPPETKEKPKNSNSVSEMADGPSCYTFVVGLGFLTPSTQEEQKRNLRLRISALGTVLLLFLCLNLFFQHYIGIPSFLALHFSDSSFPILCLYEILLMCCALPLAYSSLTLRGCLRISYLFPKEKTSARFKIVSVLMIFALAVTMLWYSKTFSNQTSLPLSLLYSNPDSSFKVIFFHFITFVVIPTITYGAFFCGALVQYFKPFGKVLAVIVPSICFALCQGTLYYIPLTLLMGMVLSIITLYGNNVFHTLIMQGLLLTILFATSFFGVQISSVFAILAFTFAAACFIYLLVRCENEPTVLTFSERCLAVLSSPMFLAGILVGCVFLWEIYF